MTKPLLRWNWNLGLWLAMEQGRLYQQPGREAELLVGLLQLGRHPLFGDGEFVGLFFGFSGRGDSSEFAGGCPSPATELVLYATAAGRARLCGLTIPPRRDAGDGQPS